MILVWIVIGLFAFLLLLVVWIVFEALVIEVDSEKDLYQIRQGHIYRFSLFSNGESPFLVKGQVLFVPFRFRLDKLSTFKKKDKKQKAKKRRYSRKAGTKIFKAFWRSKKLKHLHVVVDTDSVVWNAVLIPPTQMFNDMLPNNYSFHVNFWGVNSLSTRLELRPANFLKHLLIQKHNKTVES